MTAMIRAADQPAPTAEVTRTHTDLEQWASLARYASEIARSMAGTAFIPDSLRVKNDTGAEDMDLTVQNATGVILTGAELNLDPMAALRSIDIIRGVPAMRAIAVRALVQSRGHQMWLVESTETRCIMRGRRKGDTETQEVRWTTDRAGKLGLLGRPTWQRMPGAMLVARASSELGRLIGADALLGIPYTAEELEDELAGVVSTAEQPATAPATTARRSTAQRRAAALNPPAEVPLPTPPKEPDLVPGENMNPPTQPETLGISDDQLKAVNTLLTKLGIKEDKARHEHVSQLLGEPVGSLTDLTDAEAKTVIPKMQEQLTRLEQARKE